MSSPGRRRGALVGLLVSALLVLPGGAGAAVLQQYPIPGGAAVGAEAMVSGADGALWFTQAQADRIGRVTTGGVFTDYPLAPGSHPVGIAAGADGALWFTEAAGRIGRLTTAGALAEYPISPGGRSLGIAPGPDGALWFTEYAGNRVGRVTPAGTLDEYALPTPNAAPVAITAGADGALWFTESGAGRIGRIDPATHAVTEFPAHPGASLGTATDPEGIAAGPDGALWFTERAANKIGRLTVTGVLTEFDAAPGPFGIAAGREGALWFTQSGIALPGEPAAPGLIGRLMTSGVLDLFPLHPQTGESPNDITAGPDGAMWITDGATIGRVGGDLTAPVPRIGGLSMTHRSFRVAGGRRATPTTFRFRLSTAADWTITILRRRPGRLLNPGDCRPARPRLAGLPTCVALTPVATLRRRAAPAGLQSLAFTGYGENGRRLPPGRYRADVVAYGIRLSSRPRARAITFTILP